jgi:3-keto-disaccharide hydrolase
MLHDGAPRLCAAGCSAILLLTSVALADGTDDLISIFDGKSPAGWILNQSGEPLTGKNIQPDGINPHGSSAYVVLHEKPVKDFVLDFDYKLSKGCNSGVFVRVADPMDPVMSGLEIALDDTTGAGLHDSGAFYDLVPPSANHQKPAGEWNHMTITAKGPIIRVVLNGKEVSTLDHDQYPKAGKRADGSDHKFTKVAIKDLNRKGYFGFQDHGQDCWFKNVKLQVLD